MKISQKGKDFNLVAPFKMGNNLNPQMVKDWVIFFNDLSIFSVSNLTIKRQTTIQHLLKIYTYNFIIC